MGVGASMDTFERIFGRRNKRAWREVFYQLGFWFVQAVFLFYLLYLANYGELRVYVFLAILCGFSAYRALFQKVYLRALEAWIRLWLGIWNAVKKLVYYVLFLPSKSIIFLIISLLLGVYKILLKGIILLFLVIFYPIRLILRVIWRLVPKNMKNYLRKTAGFLDKIKNTWNKWIKRLKR
ncbi:spore cortex biosynthesis protein YabQ [Bacillus sp. SB49]|uniref:spore cortex biosynthesis protein YabQ n=2 Tax=Bacillaceae TaxID=186817 RepID=UPI001F464D7C|nr:spore cortex biosynthesis protein YabQ [Bacillus sp. SB49]